MFCWTQVDLKYDDDKQKPVQGLGVGRKVIDKLQEIYASDFTGVSFAYDGDKSLFTIGALQHVKNFYTVVMEDASSRKWPIHLRYMFLLILCYCP